MTISDDAPIGRVLSRREVIALLGGSSVALLAACTTRAAPSATAASTVAPSVGGAAASAPAALVPSCVVRPALTEGPYFVDEKLNRSDIRTDPSNGTTKDGVPLRLAVSVYEVNGSACTPVSGALVDVWQCDALGSYSDVAQNDTVGQKFLRGYQTTDAKGVVRFTTIYPGWYMGRTVHIHFKVRTPSSQQFTSQWFFDDALTRQVFTSTVPYRSRGAPDTSNTTDGIYGSDGGGLQLKLTKDGNGYAAAFAIGLTKT
jgi:protocatechuate 3,4-dioxygenase beta subunit